MLSPSSDTDVLEEVGSSIQENLEDEVVKEALQTGLDLRQYSKQIEKELRDVENASIQDYIAESQNLTSLHNQIAACDSILERMEDMLLGFQSDLGSISSEIMSLQQQSVSLGLQLRNRQGIRGELSQFVDDMVVPDALISHILDCPVTEKAFLEQLYVLNHKINFVNEQTFKDARSCQDVRDILEKLKTKAITKIREYLLQQVYKFRKPMTNYQVPQNAMLKFKFFYEFLLANERNIAKEIRDEYIDTMSKIYFSYFKSYSGRLAKLQYEDVATKDSLMGFDDTSSRSLFAKPSLKNRATVFTIGNRGDVLSSGLEAPIVVPHAAQKNETKYPFEALFRSQQFALVDNACREYLFLKEFFLVKGPASQDLFNIVLGKTLTMFLKNMEIFVQDCYDTICLFLCIHLVFRYQLMAHKRAVPALDRYWETMQGMLWPRFEYIVQINIQSIRDCDPIRLGPIDMKPHYITRRYAEFSAALVAINESFPDERVHRLLAQLQEEVAHVILKMAAAFPHRKEQLIFLINNYDMILSVMNERARDDSKEAERFREQLNSKTSEYVEEVLSPNFGGIMQFVKECEMAIERGQVDALKKEERKATTLVQVFSSSWRKSLDELNHEILASFPNFKNGTGILQLALTQLVQYYHRFQKILNQPAFKNLPVRSELINIHHLMVEVKKYKPNF